MLDKNFNQYSHLIKKQFHCLNHENSKLLLSNQTILINNNLETKIWKK